MNATKAPEVKPVPYKAMPTKQSKYPELPPLPTRALLLAPSGAGGSTFMQWCILDGYRGAFSRVFVFSPTVHLDKATWDPVKRHVHNEMSVPLDEQCFFDTWDVAALERILAEAEAITEYCRRKKKPAFHTYLAIDDFGDQAAVARGQLLTSIYLRGRHALLSCHVKVQSLRLLGAPIRRNALSWFVWSLRTGSDLEALLDELSAIHPEGRKGVLRLYKQATTPKYGFLYVDVTAPPSEMFHANFKQLSLDD